MSKNNKPIIEFSNRIHRLPPYLFGELNDMKLKKRKQGIDIIDLGMGNPDKGTPSDIVEQMQKSVEDTRNHRYSASRGIYNLRRAITDFYKKRRNVVLDPETEAIAVIGTKEGLSHLSLALLGPGDTAIVPSPYFPIHIYSVVLAGANTITIPMIDENDNFISEDTLISTMQNLVHTMQPKPKVLFLNFPHNPTAMTIPDITFFNEIVKFAKKYNIMVIHDFAYGDITFDDYIAPSFLQARGAKDIGVEFYTMSKSFNMAGWRIGFCIGNAAMVGALAKIKGYYDYGIFQAVQISAIRALRGDHTSIKEAALLYQHRRDILVDGLNRIGWPLQPNNGTMFMWAPIPEKYKKMGSLKFCKWMMDDAEVSITPGIGFGDEGDHFVRIALVENEQRIKQAIRQMNRVLRLIPDRSMEIKLKKAKKKKTDDQHTA